MTQLSNRQYTLLKMLADRPSNWYLSEGDAASLDQRPFRSFLIRGWIDHHSNRGFFLTKAGRDAWHVFQNTTINRLNHAAPLCQYFYDMIGRSLRPSKRPQTTRLPGLSPDTARDRSRHVH